jgi:hypothetical protein
MLYYPLPLFYQGKVFKVLLTNLLAKKFWSENCKLQIRVFEAQVAVKRGKSKRKKGNI